MKTVQHKALPTQQVAPKAEHINTSAPLTAAEEQLIATVDFQRKKTKKKEERWTFTYKAPWGPAHNKMRRSSWYPSKAAAARAIYEWAGADWPQRGKCKPLTGAVLAAANEQVQVKEEHRISMQIRQLRQEYVRWLTQELKGKDLVNTAAIVEDDSLCSLLLACFEHGEGQEDALQQALKGLRGVMTGRGVFFETHRLEELEEATITCFLVNHNKHWAPFWRKTFAGPYTARPWITSDSTKGFEAPFSALAEKLDCNLDLTARASGDCGLHSLLILQTILTQAGCSPAGQAGTLPANKASATGWFPFNFIDPPQTDKPHGQMSRLPSTEKSLGLTMRRWLQPKGSWF